MTIRVRRVATWIRSAPKRAYSRSKMISRSENFSTTDFAPLNSTTELVVCS